MRFFNRYILLYALIVLLSCLGFFAVAISSGSKGIANAAFLVYLAIVFGSAFMINRRDEFHNYYGFSYHLVSYVVSNGVPLTLAAIGILPHATITATLYVMAFWGVGLLFHFLMYWFLFRKKTIGQYDKEDVFR
jgi:hypothetical protein